MIDTIMAAWSAFWGMFTSGVLQSVYFGIASVTVAAIGYGLYLSRRLDEFKALRELEYLSLVDPEPTIPRADSAVGEVQGEAATEAHEDLFSDVDDAGSGRDYRTHSTAELIEAARKVAGVAAKSRVNRWTKAFVPALKVDKIRPGVSVLMFDDAPRDRLMDFEAGDQLHFDFLPIHVADPDLLQKHLVGVRRHHFWRFDPHDVATEVWGRYKAQRHLDFDEEPEAEAGPSPTRKPARG